MPKKTFVATSLMALLHQVAWAQSTDTMEPLRAVQAAKSNAGEFEALFHNATPSTDEWDALPDCWKLQDTNSPPLEPNWAQFHMGQVGKKVVTALVETTSVRHCKRSGDKFAIYWTKTLFSDGDYFLRKFKFDCSNRDGNGAEKSWLYQRNGQISEVGGGSGIGNPIPIGSAYKLMKFICDIKSDKSITVLTEPQLIWAEVDGKDGDVRWSILMSDLTKDYYSRSKSVSFWIRKDYSNVKWTKFRHSYSFDKIDCDAARYEAGQAYAFLPNAKLGEAVYEETMSSIAPGSVQETVMRTVCNDFQ